MVTIRQEKPADVGAREALLDAAFGPRRLSKTAERLREQRAPAAGLSFVACEKGRVIGTVRLWHVTAGRSRHALLLGPIAVDAGARKRGIGAALMRRAMNEAKRLGHASVLLVGDAPYYGRFGFSAEKTGGLWLPGPYELHRLLACELVPGALERAHGLIAASKGPKAKPSLADMVARVGGKRAAVPQGA